MIYAAMATSWLAAALCVWAVEWSGAPWWGVLIAIALTFIPLVSLYSPKVHHVIQTPPKP